MGLIIDDNFITSSGDDCLISIPRNGLMLQIIKINNKYNVIINNIHTIQIPNGPSIMIEFENIESAKNIITEIRELMMKTPGKSYEIE